MTAREELAAVLAEHQQHIGWRGMGIRCVCGWSSEARHAAHRDHVADALLASPALASLIREAKAEAWDEGTDCNGRPEFNPYRDLTEEPT